MACSKYSLKNTGTKPTLFNYRRCQDAIWQYEVPLAPGQSKNIWLIDGTYSTLSRNIQVNNLGPYPVPVPPPPPQYWIDINLSLQIIPGSLSFNYILASNIPVPQNTTVNFTSTFHTFYGDDIVITTGVTIYTGNLSGSTLIYFEDQFLGNLTGEQTITVFGSSYPDSTITTDQIILDAIVIDGNGVLNLGNDYYLDYIILPPTPSVTPSVTPTLTPFLPPTPTPTPGLSPTPTPSTTQGFTPTPSITPTQTPIIVNPFISIWRTVDMNQSITLPLDPNGNYYCSVDWGDGTDYTLDGYVPELITHTYSIPGDYTVTINGKFEGFNFGLFDNTYSALNLIEISKWGCLKLGNGGSYFLNCNNLNLQNVVDVIDLSETTDLSSMFNNCTSLTSISGVNLWDVSSVTGMSSMFANSNFNSDIGDWNVSNVTDMSYMFLGNNSFNQDIGQWYVGSVANFSGFMESKTSLTFDAENLTSIYNNWPYFGVLQPNLNISFGTAQYNFIGQDGRDTLTNIFNWTITDGGLVGNPFVSIWQTTSPFESITLPLVSSGTYDFVVDWGDGNIDTITAWDQLERTHTYDNPDVYTVTITGTIEGFSFGLVGGSATNIIEILRWGGLKFGATNSQFQGCSNLILTGVTDTPILAGTTSLSFMFNQCYFLSEVNNLNNWNVSGVLDMSYMFYQTIFNQNISNWDVSNVTNMEGMFWGTNFNQDISSWTVSSVTNMGSMFAQTPFNWNISSWNVSNVTNMNGMFYYSEFNSPLSGWNVSNVTDMSEMFIGDVYFNQNINNWNVSGVTNMSRMFLGSISFNSPLSGWNTSNVVDMNFMFNGATGFSQDISTWNVSNVVNMSRMFEDANSFNSDISSWNVYNVTSMTRMFFNATSFNQDLSGWCVTNIPSTPTNFATGASAWTLPKPVWGTCPFVSVWETTTPSESISLPLDTSWGVYNFDVDWGDGTSDTITAATQVETTHTYSVANSYNVSIRGVIEGFTFSLYSTYPNNSKIKEIKKWGCLTNNSSTRIDFYLCDNLTFSGITDILNLGSGTSMQDMFAGGCGGNVPPLVIPRIDEWNVSNITNMGALFNTSTFNQNINSWDTRNVTTMYGVFSSCSTFNQPLNNWVTSACTNMSSMFDSCNFNQDISMWDVSNVTNMNFMFYYSPNFNQNIGSWDVSKVLYMENMFENATSFNQDLSSWCVTNISFTPTNFATGASAWVLPKPVWGTCPFVSIWKTTTPSESITLPLESGGTYDFIVNWGDGNIDTINSWNQSEKTHTYTNASAYTVIISGQIEGFNFGSDPTSRLNISEILKWGCLKLGNNGLYFNYCLNLSLSGVTDILNLTNTTSLYGMFDTTDNITTINNINLWNVSGVTNMSGMFNNSVYFNDYIGDWDVSSVTDMSGMFVSSSFNSQVSGWNVSNVVNMSNMFADCNFNQDISMWDVSNVTDMSSMFSFTPNFNQNISAWNVSGVTNMIGMFYNATSFNQNLNGWCVTNIPSLPFDFDTGATAWTGGTSTRPQWGTCP